MKIDVQQILMKLHADIEVRHHLLKITMKMNSFMRFKNILEQLLFKINKIYIVQRQIQYFLNDLTNG